MSWRPTPSSMLFRSGSGHVVLSVEQIGDQIELTVADDGVGMKDKDTAKSSGETRLRLCGDLRASAWRHDRAVETGTNRNDRQNTASLASGPIRRCRADSCVGRFQADRRRSHHSGRVSVVVLPVATASPVTSAAEQQQEHDDNQEHVHRSPPFRMRRGGVALPIAPAILYASLQIQLLAEFKTNAPNAKKFQNQSTF